MKRAYLIAEGQNDIELLQKVLRPDVQQGVQFVAVEGGLPSLASSLLMRRRIPVAVFMDADSLNPELIAERRDNAEEWIRMAARSVPAKVVLVVPELETCFFVVPAVIERVLGTQIPAHLIPLGRRDPKGVLNYLESTSSHRWDLPRAIAELRSEEVERIRENSAIQELTAFLESLPVPISEDSPQKQPA